MKKKKKYSSVIYIYGNDDVYSTKEYKKALRKNNFKLKVGTKKSFAKFIDGKAELQIDTETNVTDFVTERELYVLQFGNVEGTEQHIFDIPRCGDYDDVLKEVLASDIMYYAQNAKFEYKIIATHYGVKIRKFRDTMLAARIIHSGIAEPGQNALDKLLDTYLHIGISKDAQTTFDGLGLTPGQIYYAAMDVVYLSRLYISLHRGITSHDLGKVLKLRIMCCLR